MTPYYDDGTCVIYHGDCRDVLPALDRVAAVVTDPPYGIGRTWNGGSGSGWANSRAVGGERNAWDQTPPSADLMRSVLAAGDDVIVWGGNYFGLPPSRCWLVWDKQQRRFSLADCELAWTNLDKVARIFERPRMSPARGDAVEHPTQKPIELMRWCLGFVREGTVLDPFMGSGTTLRAAKDCNRRAIGIEINERYCEVAAKRLAQEVLAL